VLVKSAQSKADFLTRVPLDKGDYTLTMETFWQIKILFKNWINPEWDIFASPGNHKFPNFISRWPHFQAKKWML
jgi:hypothetical protein